MPLAAGRNTPRAAELRGRPPGAADATVRRRSTGVKNASSGDHCTSIVLSLDHVLGLRSALADVTLSGGTVSMKKGPRCLASADQRPVVSSTRTWNQCDAPSGSTGLVAEVPAVSTT